LLAAFHRNDLATAREEQYRSVRIVQKLFDTGYVGAAKETMAMIGVPVGPPRLPCASLSDAAKSLMRSDLEKMGFLDWIQSK
jgi:dihydrodipicolinate synthase/N-acetylneuraminate lyase